jgi:hypothetical protein
MILRAVSCFRSADNLAVCSPIFLVSIVCAAVLVHQGWPYITLHSEPRIPPPDNTIVAPLRKGIMHTRHLIVAALGLTVALLTASPVLASPLATREDLSGNVYDARQAPPGHENHELDVRDGICICIDDVCLC